VERGHHHIYPPSFLGRTWPPRRRRAQKNQTPSVLDAGQRIADLKQFASIRRRPSSLGPLGPDDADVGGAELGGFASVIAG
jgi:hypothetical protein